MANAGLKIAEMGATGYRVAGSWNATEGVPYNSALSTDAVEVIEAAEEQGIARRRG
jgi:hypothetical protein